MEKTLQGSVTSVFDQDDLPSITYVELGLHNTERSAFIAYDRLVYDVTGFLSKHPGGKDIILTGLGTDVTNTLDSFHDVHVSRLLVSEDFRRAHGIKLVGRLSTVATADHNRLGLHDYQSRRDYRTPDPMGDKLRREVFRFLRHHNLPVKKPFAECLTLLLIFYGAMACCVYLGFIKGFWWACLALGPVNTFAAVNMGHTVMHGGFSKNRVSICWENVSGTLEVTLPAAGM